MRTTAACKNFGQVEKGSTNDDEILGDNEVSKQCTFEMERNWNEMS